MKVRSPKLLVVAAIALAGAVTGLSAPAFAQSVPTRYVALGDSVAAGDGLPVGTSDEDAVCGRSASGYPNLVARSLGVPVTNLTCSGAGAYYGVIKSQTKNGYVLPSQLDRTFQGTKPTLVTMTVGANDTQWSSFIQRCAAGGCGSTRTERLLLDAKIYLYRKSLQANLLYTLYKFDDLSGGSAPRVYVSGYYAPISNTSCTGGKLSQSDLAWLNKQVTGLNDDIRNAVSGANRIAGYTYASYVPVDFTGHGLCSNDPWVQGPSGGAPLHPTATGQAVIAQSFLSAMR